MSGYSEGISEIVNLIKVTREKALLGLYPDAIRKFEMALKIIKQHKRTLSDESLINSWTSTEKSIKEEVDLVRQLADSTDELSGEAPCLRKVSSRADERPIKHSNMAEKKPAHLKRGGSHNDHLDVQVKAPGYNQRSHAREGGGPQNSERFGGLQPFEHNHIPKEMIRYDEFGNIINPTDGMYNDYPSHNSSNKNYHSNKGYNDVNDGYSGGFGAPDYSGRGGRQPYQQQMPQQPYYKDPDVWDPPSPRSRQQAKPKTRQQPAKRRARPARPATGNSSTKASSSKANDGKRDYDKPWLPPPKKEKKKAETFLEHCYPD